MFFVKDISFCNGLSLLDIYLGLNSFPYVKLYNYIFEVVFYDSSKDDLLQLVIVVTAEEPLGGSKT
jgi:hypothetical protein